MVVLSKSECRPADRPPARLDEGAVVRYGKEHKQVTRRRIIEAAGRRFKRDGIDGSGVATLMADAGLTNGAFYAHFDSKDDLVATAVADQLRGQCEGLRCAGARPRRSRAVRAGVPLGQHRDNPEDGCPSAALLDEIGRCADATKQAYTDGVLAVIDDIAARLAPDDPQSARVKTLSVFALMVGTLQLSRALADRQLADEVLGRHPQRRPRAARRRAPKLRNRYASAQPTAQTAGPGSAEVRSRAADRVADRVIGDLHGE